MERCVDVGDAAALDEAAADPPARLDEAAPLASEEETGAPRSKALLRGAETIVAVGWL